MLGVEKSCAKEAWTLGGLASTELGFVAARKQSPFENPILRFDSHFDSTFC